MRCAHEIWEQESAVADGMCPLCLAATLALVERRLEASERLRTGLANALAKEHERGFQDGLMAANAVAADLENRWRKSAERIRHDHTWEGGWFTTRKFVAPKAEQSAKDIEAAADGLKAVQGIVLTLKPSAETPPAPETS
jgi:hypothetical protein